jgi:outer membrane translocation and assembly module TamA
VLFGPVEVTGQGRQDEGFILRQIPFVRGQPFSQAALDKARRVLLDTGFYSSVNLTPDFEHLRGAQAPILVEVKEAKRHSVRLGLGWGNEDQFRLRILQVNRDVLGLNDTLSFEGKISYIYQGLVGRLKLPELPSRLMDTVITGGVEQKDNEAFINRRYFLNPMLEYRLQDRWSWFLGYNVEQDRMVELKSAVPDPASEKQQIYISSLPMGLKYDSRDSILDPKRGTFFQVDVETASDAIGSEVEFIRPQAEVRHILPVTFLPGWFLASRAKAGLAYPLPGTERIPLVRRFFPGGADSVRGFPFQGLGPLDSAGKPLGGEAMAEASVELRFPLWGDLGGVAFVDAGNAWENISTEIGALRFTGGGGLRYQTPVGPIRLDLGYQLNPPDHSPLSRYEVYLSVGQAF